MVPFILYYIRVMRTITSIRPNANRCVIQNSASRQMVKHFQYIYVYRCQRLNKSF